MRIPEQRFTPQLSLSPDLTYQSSVFDEDPGHEGRITWQSLQCSLLFVLQLLTLQEVFLDEPLGSGDHTAAAN